MVTEPAEKGLVHPAWWLPGFVAARQVLATMPQDGVGERHGGSYNTRCKDCEEPKKKKMIIYIFFKTLTWTPCIHLAITWYYFLHQTNCRCRHRLLQYYKQTSTIKTKQNTQCVLWLWLWSRQTCSTSSISAVVYFLCSYCTTSYLCCTCLTYISTFYNSMKVICLWYITQCNSNEKKFSHFHHKCFIYSLNFTSHP